MQMRKKVLMCLVASLFFTVNFILGVPSVPDTDINRTEELRREIRVFNLVNGLDLTKEQMKMVLENAEKSEHLRKQFKTMLLFKQNEIGIVLEEIKPHLKENRETPSSVARNYHRLSNEIKRAKIEMDERIRELALEVKENLEQHQLYQLEQYVPCVIPPKGESRIGQAKDYKGMTKSFERIRRIPYRIYERRKDNICRRTLDGLKLHAYRGVDFNEKEMIGKVQKIYDKVRRLDAAEFEIQKETLAEELHSLIKPPLNAINLTRKIELFLLSSEIIPILEERTLDSEE